MTIIVWSLLVIAVLGVLFFGAVVLWLIFGSFAFLLGFLSFASKNFDRLMRHYFPDSELDKKMFSEECRNYIRDLTDLRLLFSGLIMISVFFIFSGFLRLDLWFVLGAFVVIALFLSYARAYSVASKKDQLQLFNHFHQNRKPYFWIILTMIVSVFVYIYLSQ